MKQLIPFLAFIIMLSCNQKSDTTKLTSPANIDSLAAVFNAGWNNKDSSAIMKAIEDNAILMEDSLIYKGHSAIADNWVSGGVKVVSNIKTSSVVQNSDEKIAYDGGTYKHDLTLPGGVALNVTGNYSFVWTKQSNGEWKLTLIHINAISAKRDVK